MTRLVTSLLCEGPAEAARAVNQAFAGGTDAVEIRLDGWSGCGSTWAPLAEVLPQRRWIVTCRPTSEGGYFRGDLDQRVSRLVEAAAHGDGYLDFELADWRRSAEARRKIRQAVAQPDTDNGPRLILSSHDYAGRPGDLAALLAVMSAEPDLAAAKLAWPAQDICDNLVVLDLLRGASVPLMAVCMGEGGLMSRVLARKFGAFASYCAPSAGAATAPGQVTLKEMLSLYRWRSIDESTRVFGVIGCPVAQSMSPALFNACFERDGLNAVYLPLRVEPSPEVLGRFLNGCAERPWLDVGGFSVTLPHIQSAAALVGDRIDALARRIGAVNTLVPVQGGFHGYNTDYTAALGAITDCLNCDRRDLAGLRVDLLGAGGAARAVVAGLRNCDADVTLYNRTAARAQALAREFGCNWRPWEQRRQRGGADLVVNCTSLGMWPDVDESPLQAEHLADQPLVFDTVYNPAETRLLREAKRAGCRTIDGLTMFVNQAAAQFELWTGHQADKPFMRQTIQARLQQTGRPSQDDLK